MRYAYMYIYFHGQQLIDLQQNKIGREEFTKNFKLVVGASGSRAAC